jgi:sodium-dependent dicarboxylate transporter 2/3/5
MALGILSWEWVARSPRRVMFALGALTAALSMWISNTATAAIMLPIALGLWRALGGAPPDARAGGRFGTGLMLLVAYAASLGGLATPVGSPPNLIALGALEKLAGVKISFLSWMLFALPVTAALYLVLFFFLAWVCPPPAGGGAAGQAFVAVERQRLGPWTRGQRNTLLAFALTVVLWLAPGAAALVWGSHSTMHLRLERHVPEPAAALAGAVLLFMLPVNWRARTFTLQLRQALEIDWATLLLFGGGLALGEQMFQTGLARAVGQWLVELTGANSLPTLTVLAVGLAMLMTETTSNTASANTAVPLVIGLALAADVNAIPPALGAAFGASMGFLLPVSTPPNAIVYSSGLVPILRMVTYGLAMSVAAYVVVSCAACWWLPRVVF